MSSWNERLGINLRKARKVETLVEASRDMGIHENTLANWEQGKTAINAEALATLASYYGVEVASLLPSPDAAEGVPA